MTEKDVLFEKKYDCPVCHANFESKTVRTSKLKMEHRDQDLRTLYSPCDSIKYDAVVCPTCGYGALAKNFGPLSNDKAEAVRQKISEKFKGLKAYGDTYDYDEAIERTKLVLMSALVTEAGNGDKGYICLKLAWLYRGYRESTEDEAKKPKLEEEEMRFLKNAYDSFNTAYNREDFPIGGMDEPTLSMVMGETARKLGDKASAEKWLGGLITNRDASDRLKQMARENRNLVKEMPDPE